MKRRISSIQSSNSNIRTSKISDYSISSRQILEIKIKSSQVVKVSIVTSSVINTSSTRNSKISTSDTRSGKTSNKVLGTMDRLLTVRKQYFRNLTSYRSQSYFIIVSNFEFETRTNLFHSGNFSISSIVRTSVERQYISTQLGKMSTVSLKNEMRRVYFIFYLHYTIITSFTVPDVQTSTRYFIASTTLIEQDSSVTNLQVFSIYISQSTSNVYIGIGSITQINFITMKINRVYSRIIFITDINTISTRTNQETRTSRNIKSNLL